MNEDIIKTICGELNIKYEQVVSVLEMLKDGNTIPFIARYRKGATGGLSEEEIKRINEYYEYEVNLLKRKEDVIRLIDEKGMMTDELRDKIMSANKLVEVEDLYRPYKEKKKTKATEAIAKGLEPLAKIIMSFPNGSIEEIAKKYVNDKVSSVEEAIEGAKYIIAEYISDDAYYRKWLRSFIYRNGFLKTSVKKNAEDEKHVYELYYDFNSKVTYLKPHNILAINRAEKENVITAKIDINDEEVIAFISDKVIKGRTGESKELIIDAIKDSYKRLIFPAVEREVRSELTEKGEDSAISNFSKNLEALLLTPPMKGIVVLAFDPGYVNGCKLAVVNKNGDYLDSTVIKPFLNNISVEEVAHYEQVVVNLIKKYNVDVIAIGNGTASRESERFCANLIKDNGLNTKYVIVSEAGASIYSASEVAVEEFPNLEIEKRSAVSIGRRLQDPLAELVKIPPSGIGVGLYQHDVSTTKLSNELDFVVEKCVNSVGVNVNTASFSLLKYVSGLTKKTIEKLMDYRTKVGIIHSREEIKKNKILTDKTFEQAIGFLRILDGDNPLDKTSIHPESYSIALYILKENNLDITKLGTEELIEKLNNIDVNYYKDTLETDIYTIEMVIESLKKPNLDPRSEYPQPILKSDVLELSDLKRGMKLQGTVRNVVDFGLFIDIGLHEDGLAHISKLSKNFVKHPSDLFSVGDIVDVYVDDINMEKKKVSLSLLDPNKN